MPFHTNLIRLSNEFLFFKLRWNGLIILKIILYYTKINNNSIEHLNSIHGLLMAIEYFLTCIPVVLNLTY